MKVLEVSQGPAGAYAGLLLSQLGFTVDRLVTDKLASELSASQGLFLHRDKGSVHPGALALHDYDAVVEDVGKVCLRDLDLSWRKMRVVAPNTTLVSLSPFGLSGPRADWDATDLIVQAAGGVMHITGYEHEAPFKLPGDTAAMIAGLHGATAALAAASGVQQGVEEAVHVDISAQDTLMQHWTRHISQYAYAGTLMARPPKVPEGIHLRHTAMAADGYVYMLALGTPWQDVARFLGLDEFITPEYAGPGGPQPWAEMEAAFHEAIAGKAKYDWFTDAAARGWTFAPVEDPFSLATNPQTRARQAFEQVSIDGQELPMPAMPFRNSE